ncbi:MAG: TolC family protein [Acidobacteriota bacterium]|nr:TolC family protein [Acidobacteriota bacterium]
MYRFQPVIALFCIALLAAPAAPAQVAPAANRKQAEMPPYTREDGRFSRFTGPYKSVGIAPINLSNSYRLDSLLRAGNLYLSLQDAIALTLENNLDIEIQRYGAQEQDANILRAQAGGALRGVTPGVQGGAVSAGLGQATGITQTAAASANATASNNQGALVQQTGTVIPNFDPTLSGILQWQHTTQPQASQLVTGITTLIQGQNTQQLQLSQGFATGTSYSLGYSEVRLSSNNTRNTFNPFRTGSLSLTIRQNLLQGFGSALNRRNIVIARNSREQSDLQFKQQVITTVTSTINLYWDLVSFNDDVKSKQQSLAYNERLYNDNKKQVEIGTLAPIEIVRAEAAVATSQQDLILAQTRVLQQETTIKTALSRNGVASPSMVDAHIIPTDRIEIPDVEPIQPYQDLVAMALSARPELAQQRIAITNNNINARGSKSELLPSLQAFTTLSNNGLAGAPSTVTTQPTQITGTETPVPVGVNSINTFLVGGYGNLFGQLFRRNYPDYSIGLSLNIPLRNRTAQADYIIDQLTVRQSELSLQRLENQVRTDVRNAMIGIQQSRASYQAAVKARILQEQTLDAEQKKLALGASTIFNVILVQRDLATAQANEVAAADSYKKAQVELHRSIGDTLSANNISVEDAFRGSVPRPPSPIPAAVQ